MSKFTINMAGENNTVCNSKERILNGYLLTVPLTSDNSGFSKWGFCTKNGKEYFIKEFVNPVFPSESVELAEDIRSRKITQCLEWYDEKRKLYYKLLKSQNGNLVVPVSFFRYDSHFYLVTDKVEKSKMDMKMISQLDIKKKIILLKVLSDCFCSLSRSGIVHSDVKPDNLIIKETKNGYLTIKVIDFDASYFEDSPPFGDDIQGDPVYYAPETFLAIMEYDDAVLSTKADVFSLGIIFHQILCGGMPVISPDYDYVYEAVLDNAEVTLNSSINDTLQILIKCMLKKDPAQRIGIKEVYDDLDDFYNFLLMMEAPEPEKPVENVRVVSADTVSVAVHSESSSVSDVSSKWHMAKGFD